VRDACRSRAAKRMREEAERKRRAVVIGGSEVSDYLARGSAYLFLRSVSGFSSADEACRFLEERGFVDVIVWDIRSREIPTREVQNILFEKVAMRSSATIMIARTDDFRYYLSKGLNVTCIADLDALPETINLMLSKVK